MIGGFIGATGRYIVGEWLLTKNGFPIGTLTVNLIGCLALGWLLPYAAKRFKQSTSLIPFIGTGILGAFTTFSTFSFESLHLLLNKQFGTATLYVLGSILLGTLFSYVGYKLASFQLKRSGYLL